MPVSRPAIQQTPRSTTYRLHEFDPSSYDWDDWEILFDTYIDVEGITDDTKKRNLLITALSVQPFKTLISICKPKKPNECSFQEILQKLRTNYTRVTFSSTERIKFFATRQDSSQTLTDFANGLRDNTVTCNFPVDFYEQALITAFVGGLRNDHIRQHLMQQNLETFEQTLSTARTFESVLIQGANVKRDLSEDFSVMKIHERRKQNTNLLNDQSICLSCGSSDHARSKCRFRNVTCHKCNKEGHIAKVCRSNITSNESNVNTISSATRKRTTGEQPIQVVTYIDGLEVKFELDTGSPITIINENIWNKMGKPNLQSVKSVHNSFSGHSIPLKGEKMVMVNYRGLRTRLRILVGDKNRNNILGRNWINALHLNEISLGELINNNKVPHVNAKISNLNEFMHSHNDIFKEGLGCCKMKTHLYNKYSSTPHVSSSDQRSQRCRSSSIFKEPVRELIEENLKRRSVM
ncbi:unnamed protein product [Rotaria magnacalcarata]|uniref:CCHC-type domain-containing protein n=1 Tax=Rotaria magnacalcarata TaxID=392030 RepID=A0A815W7H1_9BILA|nr:unnamed protein product [Rotaria magnacalcarata]